MQSVHLPKIDFMFEGRFAVVRKEQDLENAQVTLYIGEGRYLSFQEHLLEADTDKKALLEVEVELELTNILDIKNPKIIKVYPNPASEEITSLLDGSPNTEVTIFNLSGQMVYRKVTSNKTIQIARGTEFPSGVYLITVTDENKKTYHQRFIFK